MRSPVDEASPDFSDGVMLAVYLDADTAATLAVDGGLPPDDMHVTVAYLGHVGDVDVDRLRAAAGRVANRPPIRATISGHARFTGGDKGDVIVALVDSPDLERLRRDTVDALTAEGVGLPSEHGYCAHATLTYVDPDEPSPVERVEPLPVTFSALAVVYGGTRDDLPFTPRVDGLAAALREAYAEGWAASGGPMTDQVKAGCVAAVRMGLDHADHPGIFEATLHLGHLEGVWATIYDRRADLHARARAAVGKTWRNLVANLDVDRLVRAARRRAGLYEAFDDVTDAEITAIVLGSLHNLDANTAQWSALRQALRDAVANGRAEGATGALALAADRAGKLGFQYGAAFDDAHAALENVTALWSDADRWVNELFGDAAADIGRTLARMTRDETPFEEMRDTVAGILDDPDMRALTVAAGLATGWALTRGALDLYASQGVSQASVVTAGTNVCNICEGYEANSPYRLADTPAIPAHPHCMCSVVTSDPLPLSAIQPYLPPKG